MEKIAVFIVIIAFISACAEIEPKPFPPSKGHLEAKPSIQPKPSAIPKLIEQLPVLPQLTHAKPVERYTVVVNELPVKEILFALARDAKINVDIHPDIDGIVTINAVDQTLPQILKRIANQVDMRYEQEGDNLIISKDVPFLRTYIVDYVNVVRDTVSQSSISTQIASTSGASSDESGGSGGGNSSVTDVSSESNHQFWSRLVSNISSILDEGSQRGQTSSSNKVITNPESGVISVKATSKQHEQIQEFVDRVLASAKRQVVIQATIVEVELNERYRAGINWERISAGAFSIASNFVVPEFTSSAALSSFSIRADTDNITAIIELLNEFGDSKILSSPQMMVLNNQTALLKVVENIVYFEIDVQSTATQGVTTTSVDTDVKTVPVGIVMTITPQIGSTGAITLIVRPTVSRLVRFVNDPNPNLVVTGAGGTTLTNPVPQIAVREMESVLRLVDGQIGVLGGLMTDESRGNDAGVPGVENVGFLGNLFKRTSEENIKRELVIFLKSVVIRNPDINDDLEDYKNYLSRSYSSLGTSGVRTGEQL